MARVTGSRRAREEKDRYLLLLQGRPVSRVYLDGRFGICFFSGGPKTEIAIGSRFRFLEKGHEHTGNAEDPKSLTPLLDLFSRRVAKAEALKTGNLRIEFEDDSVLEVHYDEKFEAWEISADDGLKVVSTPGGGIAFWQSLSQEK